MFLRSESWLGLQGTNGRPLHAWLHQKSNNQVQTYYPYMFTTSSIQVYLHPIWRQGPTLHITRHRCPSHQRWNQTYPRHCWHITLLWTSCRTNHSHCYQCNSISSNQRHIISLQRLSPTPWLERNSSYCCHPIPCKWHDSCTWHWWILPLWTRWQNHIRWINVTHQ